MTEVTLPEWVVVGGGFVLIIAVVWAWIATSSYNDTANRLRRHRLAWDHLAKMAPLLVTRDTFGHQPYDYWGYINQDQEPTKIDISRVIEAGQQYDERKKYSKVFQELKTLDKVLGPLRADNSKNV